tara:strand:- start:10 stop:894 length:885 start_codon:yes stop_codon:yes gene_type:complete
MAQQSPPGMFNLEELNRTILHAANMPNLEQILPPKIEPQPLDPVSDIMAATKGIPITAFPGQNHDAHIQTKTAYLQDPQNGANPIMARIKPVLEANIQEHSVMKYQEQMNGVTQQMLQQAPPEQAQQPAAIEMAMSQAAQQVLKANQQPPQPTPEQQLVELEQQKVQLQQQKLQSDTAVQAAEMELKNKKLELEENEQIIDILKSNASENVKKELLETDKESKKDLKVMDLLSKHGLEEDKLEESNRKELTQFLKEMIKDREKETHDLEVLNLNALAKLALEQLKKEKTNDEEG